MRWLFAPARRCAGGHARRDRLASVFANWRMRALLPITCRDADEKIIGPQVRVGNQTQRHWQWSGSLRRARPALARGCALGRRRQLRRLRWIQFTDCRFKAKALAIALRSIGDFFLQ